jgi:hypothetical protein
LRFGRGILTFVTVTASRAKVGLWVVLGVGGLLRLGWAVHQGSTIDPRLPDQHEYLNLANNVQSGQGFTLYDPRFGQNVLAFRMPGYPLFLAACGGNVLAARIVQALLDTATILAAWLLARRWRSASAPSPSPCTQGEGWGEGSSPIVPLLAAAFVALNPFLIYFSSLVLSETLFVAMLAWGMVLLAYRRNFLWGGLVLAASVHIRPSAVALPVALGFCWMFVRRASERADDAQRRRTAGLRVPLGSAMLLLVIAFLLPWAYRNHLRLGQWVWLTTGTGITLYDGFNPGARGHSDQSFLAKEEMRPLLRLSETQRDQALSGAAMDWIRSTLRQDPARLLDLTLAKLARTWSPVPLSADFGGESLHQIAAAAWSIPLFVLALVGLCLGRLPRAVKVFLLVPAIYLTLVHAFSVGSLRYRMPADVPLAVLAAYALTIRKVPHGPTQAA